MEKVLRVGFKIVACLGLALLSVSYGKSALDEMKGTEEGN